MAPLYFFCLFMIVVPPISRKSLFERIKMLWIDQEVQPSAFNAGFTIDLYCVPLVYAL